VEAQATLWMAAAKRGDREAFDQLTRSLRSRAYAVALGLVGSSEDAHELCQEAFLKTYDARDTFREGEPFLPWFHRILRNTCFSFLRKHRRLTRVSLGGTDDERPSWEIADDEEPPSSLAEQDEAARAFWEGFRCLNARDREILSLRHFQELSYREIAEVLSVPEGTVMSRLFHARARLRRHLERHLSGALEEYAGTSAPARVGGAS
jgi:RNA polymerase sigma-70 factor (ECF subfamily)